MVRSALDSDSSERGMKAAFTPGTTFAGYRMDSVVGRGGMGVVYRAWDVSLERPVALKLIAPELAEDERFRARFLRESRLAASLDHPSVVPIHEAGERDGQLYLAMRFVEGSDLRTLLEREGKLSPKRALKMLAQIAGALDAAHRRGLVHRDVKPANVLLDGDGHAYLADFGITKQLGGVTTDTGRMVGTLAYLAPEQIRGEDVDGRTDCYALACVLYQCLSGAAPFRRETEAETLWAHMQDEPAPLRGHPALDPVLRKALAKETGERYASCGEFLAAASSALGFEPPARRAKRLRIGRRLLLAGGVVLAAAALAAVMAEVTKDEGTPGGLSRVAPNSVAVLDPASSRVVGQVPIPGGPSLIATHGRSVWVASDARGTISEIDGRSLAVDPVVPANVAAMDMAASDDSVWVHDAQRPALVRVDAAYGTVADRLPLPADLRPTLPGLDVGPGAVWATDGTTRLLKLDPSEGRVLKTIDAGRPLDDLAVGAGAIWAISGAAARVFEIDPRTGKIGTRIPITGRPGVSRPAPFAVEFGEGAIWVLNGNDPSLTRIDPQLAAVTDTIPLGVGSNPSAIATGAGAAWVALRGEGTVARIDAVSGASRSIPVGGAPTGVAVGSGRVWVSVQPGFRAGFADRGQGVRVPGEVEQPFCTPVEFAGKGVPRLLIVSDLPLQTPRSSLQPLQFTDAIRFVLARRDFRAGRYTVGYQSCDDSSVRIGDPGATPWTPATCRRNARAYVNAPNVVGVIGPYNSGCAVFGIPVLNRARGGPLAMISGSATAVGLTRGGPGALPGEPEVYYPGGVRNFARVVAADNVQGAAGVVMAKRLGVRSLYVLDDEEPYGIGLAETVRRTARMTGVEVGGSASWDFRDRGYRLLARRIARSGADGVYVAGYWFYNGGGLLRDLRAVLGPRVAILAPDGFSDFRAVIAQAGAAAEGLVVSVATLPPERLPPSGRPFLDAFQGAIGGEVDPYSPATAQAAEVLLDAIAASDGTRASVTEQLLKVRVEDGILGSFEFDANGDRTSAGVTMYRIEKGKPRVSAVIKPPPGLLVP
jgi:ABC-type branched-subunit amino acid transport system substrate-binding protein/DNA-binding beta-propeller fold protein YncE